MYRESGQSFQGDGNGETMKKLVLWAAGLMLWGQAANAKVVTIDFEDLQPNVLISADHYSAQGVEFDTSNWVPFGIQTAKGATSSGTHAAAIGCTPDCTAEFWVSGVRGIFVANTQKEVTVNVGLVGDGGVFPLQPAVVMLIAYDSTGRGLAKAVATLKLGAGVKTQLRVQSSSNDIASFTITARNFDDTKKLIAIDDLSFTTANQPSGPDFSLSVAPKIATVLQGRRHVIVALGVTRLNGSIGGIALSVSGLPAGVTGIFDQSTTTGQSASLELVAEATAVPNSAPVPITISATPLSSSAGPAARSTTLLLNVRANFTVLAAQDLTASPPTIVGCTPYTLGLRVIRDFRFNGQVTLQATQLPPGVHASFTNPLIDFSSGNTEVDTSVTFTVDAGTSFPAASTSGGVVPQIVGSSTGTPASVLSVALSATTSAISSFSPMVGHTPQDQSLGTEVTIQGHGFCAGSFVAFGNGVDYRFGKTQPHWVSDDGQQMKVNLPLLAMSGPISISLSADPNAADIAMSTDSLAVQSYRNQNGYAFHNLSHIDVSFDDVDDLFGDDQTHIQIDFCWPFGCTWTTPIPSPLAAIFTGIARGALNDGQCFGMGLSSQRIMHGIKPISSFAPVGATHLHDLVGPDLGPLPSSLTVGQGGDLVHYIHVQHIAQLSSEYLHHWIGQAAINVSETSGVIQEQIVEALLAGDHPLISLRNGGTGHVVVAYNIDVDESHTGVYIDVYDPNFEFANEFSLSPPLGPHRLREGFTDPTNPTYQEFGSRIHLTSGGDWLLPHGNFTSPWTGSLDTLVVTRSSVVPVVPTMPASFDGLITLIFGDSVNTSQITDRTGRTLLNSKHELNRDRTTSIAGATRYAIQSSDDGHSDIYILRPDNTYTQRIAGTGAGDYTNASISPSGMSSLTTHANTDTVDEITRNPRTAGLKFRSRGPSKSFSLNLVTSARDRSQRHVFFGTTSSNAGDQISFDSSTDKIVFVHAGPTANYHFALEWAGVQGAPSSFVSPTMQVRRGDRITVAPRNWSALASQPIELTVVSAKGGSHVQRLASSQPPARLNIGRVWSEETQQGHRVSVETSIGAPHSADDVVVLSWNVLKAGRSIERHVQQLAAKETTSGSRIDSWVVPAEIRGAVTINVQVVLVRRGDMLSSATAKRSENIELP